jgi:SAM-dependent methyltransferase/molybdopterin converting factor small subunit
MYGIILAHSIINLKTREPLGVSRIETSAGKAWPENRGDIMDSGPQIDVEGILKLFRETIWKRGQELSLAEIASTPANGQGADDLSSLQRCDDMYNIHFTSHRKILGWPIIFVKKLLRRLLTPILEQQLTYNTANARIVSVLWKHSKMIGQQQEAALQTLRTEMAAQQEAAIQTLRTEVVGLQEAAYQTLRLEMVGLQEATCQTLRLEMAGQKEAVLQALRGEMAGQKEAVLQTLRTEMAAQQEAAGQTLQKLRMEMAEQIEKVGQQRASTFQAFRETVVGQVERLGQQQDTAIQALRDMVVGQVERLGQQQDTATQALRDMVVGQVERLGQQQDTAIQALRDMVVGQVERLGEQLHHQLAERDARLVQQKTQLILQERRITILLEEARKRLPEPFSQEQLQVMTVEEKRPLEALYVSFEDQFRGTREDIKERCKVYLPLMKEAGVGTDEMPILDLGCGRGEWLEALREEGLQARGLDINPILVEECRQRELQVVEGDLIAYLRTLPDASVGGVTGFHLIEHLPFEILINSLDETVRVLKPGGLAIFETPNPQNILVGSCNFYIDPTHRRPLPSQMMQFLAEARGLCHVKILYLHPSEITPLRENTEVARRFNEYFYGPMDYAIVGRRV